MELWNTRRADCVAKWAPAASAVLSVGADILVLFHLNGTAAASGILAGVLSAGGVVAIDKASRLRDEKMNFWFQQIANDTANLPMGFGS